jgi:hypothetical protein
MAIIMYIAIFIVALIFAAMSLSGSQEQHP